MKIISRGFDFQDSNVLAGICINRGSELGRRDLALDLNARNLTFGVNTCIRSTRTMNVHAPAVDQRQSVRQLTLNSSEPLLDLPAMELCPVILNQELIVQGASLECGGLAPL